MCVLVYCSECAFVVLFHQCDCRATFAVYEILCDACNGEKNCYVIQNVVSSAEWNESSPAGQLIGCGADLKAIVWKPEPLSPASGFYYRDPNYGRLFIETTCLHFYLHESAEELMVARAASILMNLKHNHINVLSSSKTELHVFY